MKKTGLVAVVVFLVVISGVSCSYEMSVSECNLKTKGISLEISGVTYQYSVVKIGKSKNTTICDWTDFDIDTGFSVRNLRQGEYSFLVQGFILDNSSNKIVVVSGSETRSLSSEDPGDITIVLYPQFDRNNSDSKLKINLLETASKDLSAVAVCKYLGSGVETVYGTLSNCDTGFCKEFAVVPGYYEVSVSLYKDNVDVGGIVQVVMVPTGCRYELNVSIEPREIINVFDIRNYNGTDKVLEIKKGDAVTLAMPGEIGSEGNGFWMIGNSVVEDSASYLLLPSEESKEYVVTYYRGNQSWPCKVVIASGKKAVVNIMNFRSGVLAYEDACIGYVNKDTGIDFSVNPIEMEVPSNFDPADYTTLNLIPKKGSLIGAEFAELATMDQFNLLTGSSTEIKSLRKLVVHGNIGYDFFKGRLPNLEEILIIGPTSIEGNAFKNMKNLKTVRIIPAAKTSIGTMAFYGSGVTSVVVYGPESSITFGAAWNTGSSVTRDSFIFDAELPL